MFRDAVCSLVLGTFVVLGSALPAAADAPKEPKTPKPPASAARLQDILAGKVSTDEIAPNTALKDALAFLGERFNVTILIDTQAYKDTLDINEPDQMPVRLPRMSNIPLREILRALCEQAQGAFVQIGDVLWVVPTNQVLPRLLRQSVDVSFVNRPLDQALQELSDQTGASIVLDGSRVGNGNAPVTAKLRGVGLENAVRVLADAAGLKMVVVGHVLYVTDPTHAEELLKEEAQRRKEQAQAQKEEKAEEKRELKTPKKEEKKGGAGA
jgi:hypothetical protein